MRKQKDITIIDDGNELKFRVRALSALGLQTWGVKVAIALAQGGLLDVDIDEVQGDGFSIDKILRSISQKGFSFLGKLDPEKANNLILELVCKCTMRLNGASLTMMSETEIESTFSDIKALISLEKECFLINFAFIQGENLSTIPEQKEAEQNKLNAKISVTSSHR